MYNMEKVARGLFRITGYVADQGGCGNIRVAIPFLLLNQLKVTGFQFQAYYNNIFTKDLNYYKHSTIIQFQRAATDKHLELFELIRKKIKILTRSALVYEIDDSLFNIPEWNFAYDYYKTLQPYIKEMLSKADVVITSTETLKKTYSEYNKNIHVIPNHLPRFLWGETTYKTTRTKKLKIVYPCSSNHFSCKNNVQGGDIGPLLMGYIRSTIDDYDWVFSGGLPLELEDLVKAGKITRYLWHSLYEYPRFLRSLNADIAIAPLEINDFNINKSNIKALEFTALGLPAVYTRIDPYLNMSLLATTDEEFIAHIESLKDPDFRSQVWTNDCKTLADQLFWEDNYYKNLKKFVKTYLNAIGKTVDFI